MKYLRDDPFVCLLEGILEGQYGVSRTWTTSTTTPVEVVSKKTSGVTVDCSVFAIELVTQACLHASKRAATWWPLMHREFIEKVLGNISKWHVFVVQRVIISLIRVAYALWRETSWKEVSGGGDVLMKKVGAVLVDGRGVRDVGLDSGDPRDPRDLRRAPRSKDAAADVRHQLYRALEELPKQLNAPIPEKKDHFGVPATGPTLLCYYGETSVSAAHWLLRKILFDSKDPSAPEFVAQNLWTFYCSLINLCAFDVVTRDMSSRDSKKPIGCAKYAWDSFQLLLQMTALVSSEQAFKNAAHVTPNMIHDVVDVLTSFIRAAAVSPGEITISASSIAAKLAASAENLKDRSGLEASTPDQSPAVMRALEALRILFQLTAHVPAVGIRAVDGRTSNGPDRAANAADRTANAADHAPNRPDHAPSAANHFPDENDDPSEQWTIYWLPILSALSQQCYHPNREIRQHAMAYFQRTLLLPQLEGQVVSLFHDVLFPLLDTLLTPELLAMDGHGSVSKNGATIDEIRIRGSTLLCKMFLHYMVTLQQVLSVDELSQLWGQILELLERYWRCGRTSDRASPIKDNSSLVC